MTKRSTLLQLSTVAALVALGAGAWWLNREKSPANQGNSSAQNDVQREEGERMAKADAQAAARLKREPVAGQNAGAQPAYRPVPELGYGQIQGVPANLNQDTKAVAEALRTKTHPERFSTVHASELLDLEAWRKDPLKVATAYASTPAPGRVFQPAQPGEGVPVLKGLGEAYRKVLQTQPTELQVRTEPYAPVTFTSFDLGQFGNDLTTQTVVADEKGVASAIFTAKSGTAYDVHILAASPVSSGRAEFLVWVKPPGFDQASR